MMVVGPLEVAAVAGPEDGAGERTVAEAGAPDVGDDASRWTGRDGATSGLGRRGLPGQGESERSPRTGG